MVPIKCPKTIINLICLPSLFRNTYFKITIVFSPFHFQQKFAVCAQLNVRNIKICINNDKDTGNSCQAKGLSILYVTLLKFRTYNSD